MQLGSTLVAIAAGLTVCVLIALSVAPLRRRWRRWQTEQALRQFRIRRELLEAKFFERASSLGKPRGVRWLDCNWQESVKFARDRKTGLLTAFVAVNISFEAIEGGDMEDVEHVGLVRDAAAVFHYQKGRWGTGGRALFNMNPTDALSRLESQYEPVHPPE